jgi:apolipoprotein N-acyltransferase
LSKTVKLLALLLAGALSGLLYSLSIPKADVSWLAWVCFVPLFALIPSLCRSTARLLAVGFISGLVSSLGRVYWIAETLQNYGGLSPIASALTNGLLIGYLALYPTLFLLLCARALPPAHSPFFAWAAAALFVLLEWIQGWALTGFPWELLGYSQYHNQSLLQTASLTGVYGLSFLVMLANGSLAQVALAVVERGASGLRARAVTALVGPPALLCTAAFAFGSIRLAQDLTGSGEVTRIGIVQGNVSQDMKWKSNRSSLTTERYVELTRQLASSEKLDLIIFPETALPFWFRDPSRARQHQQIVDLAREISTPLLVGSLGFDRNRGNLYNTGFLLDEGGLIRDTTHKIHLVPFGEYLPLPWLFQFMEGLTAESGQFAPGEEGHKILNVPGSDLPFGVFICYESIFPEISRALAAGGASFLVNTTNDAWFGETAAPYQHLSMAVLRAVETGLPIVRVANTGISALISPRGRVEGATALFETVTKVVSVIPGKGTTFYVRHGDWFLVLCALFLVGTVAMRLQSRAAEVAALPARQ